MFGSVRNRYSVGHRSEQAFDLLVARNKWRGLSEP